MATPAAALGVQIVILLSSGSFQALLPGLSVQPSPRFPDTPQGHTAFMEWVKPQWPQGRWNPPPTRVCVVGMEPFPTDRPPQLPQPLYASKPPFRVLEPYSATFHYLGQAEQGQGQRSRTAAQAMALCGVKAK